MQNTPLVSVIVPVHNTAKYLSECLDSVISQTFSDVEIICVDDGSTDNSLDVIRLYEKKDGRVKSIVQANSGVVTARNIGISVARGKYILPLDSDDKIKNTCIEKLLELVNTNGCDVAAPSVEFFGEKTGKLELPSPTAENMAQQNCIVNCAMFKKTDWSKYGGYDIRFNDGIEDYDFWWNFLQDNKTISRTDEVLFYYRQRNGESLSRTQQNAARHGQLIRLMAKKYPAMRKYLKVKLKDRVQHTKDVIKHKSIINTRKATGLIKRNVDRSKRVRKAFLWKDYKNYVLNQQLDSSDYVPITDSPYSKKPPKKLVAFYLPQFYQIPQNDAWFGRGFTEWSNAAKAVPQFTGHWQPHLPIDVGFYNLETTHVMHRQIELARMYGIHGFCFYYYWFSGGDKIMERPVQNWLNDKTLEFPFMFFWANEDWTNTWGEQADHGTKTFSAKMKPSDIKKFAHDILPYLKDSRYITVDGRPHIIIYQPRKDAFLKEFIDGIGDVIEDHGIKRPYISLVFPDEQPDAFDPRDFGGDAAVEFGVHMRARPDYSQNPLPMKHLINPLAKLKEYDMDEFISKKSYLYEVDYPVHKGCMTTYDNTARKIYSNGYMFSLRPSLYKEWLSDIMKHSKTDFVFISAWNEWAEGMHLEPDQRFGYAYLQATKDALESSSQEQHSNR